MEIKKLPRNPMRREDEPGYEKQIWQPNWRCYCCHDTGIITPYLATLVIDGYNPKHDKLPRCINPGCEAGSEWDSCALENCIDYRVDAKICQKLDALEREAIAEGLRIGEVVVAGQQVGVAPQVVAALGSARLVHRGDRGTGQQVRVRWNIGADIAGKTGTTQNNTDGWFILMQPQLVAGAWVGFNDARVTMRSEYWGQGAHNALNVVGDAMRGALAQRLLDASAEFPRPPGAGLRRVRFSLRQVGLGVVQLGLGEADLQAVLGREDAGHDVHGQNPRT